MATTCEFKLNRPRSTYFTGQKVSGSIILTTTVDKNIRSIHIRFVGKAKVYWNDSRRYGKCISKDVSENYAFRADELCVDRAVIARGGGILQAGSHEFKFNFSIPKSCPSSHSGNYGEIRYELQLIVDRQCHAKETFTKLLTILKKVNLNLFPRLKFPITAEETYAAGCWCWSYGIVTFKLTIPYGGFASNQILKYRLEIQNQSMIELIGHKLELIQLTTYIAKIPYYKERKRRVVVTKQSYMDTCRRLSNREYHGTFIIPSLVPNSGNQGIIQLKYLLQISIIAGAYYINHSLALPIVIGNVPLVQSMRQESVDNDVETTTQLVLPETLANSCTPTAPTYFNDESDHLHRLTKP
ncbi:arrestin domain-containing protein 17-like isoform X2 [Musca autumnalis]|uniref:arrestin domain-containing protein 17-like isoform X2 n=1 Tax=Musca autumnalis TaxID=221902 RepID=UPI003CFAFE7C